MLQESLARVPRLLEWLRLQQIPHLTQGRLFTSHVFKRCVTGEGLDASHPGGYSTHLGDLKQTDFARRVQCVPPQARG